MAEYDWFDHPRYTCIRKGCDNPMMLARVCDECKQKDKDAELVKRLARLFPDSDYEGAHRVLRP